MQYVSANGKSWDPIARTTKIKLKTKKKKGRYAHSMHITGNGSCSVIRTFHNQRGSMVVSHRVIMTRVQNGQLISSQPNLGRVVCRRVRTEEEKLLQLDFVSEGEK